MPENWIPFLPVQRPGSVQDIAFQRAALARLSLPPRDAIRPKGVLLNEPELPWFINEEEVPLAGAIVTRSLQRARWYHGWTVLWMAASAKPDVASTAAISGSIRSSRRPRASPSESDPVTVESVEPLVLDPIDLFRPL